MAPAGTRVSFMNSVHSPEAPRRRRWPGWPTSIRRCCAPTTATATGLTRSSFTPPGISSSTLRSATACTRRPGWTHGPAHVARAAKFYVWSQAEAGHGCPISMTYAAVPALRHSPELAARFGPLLAAPVYQPGLRSPETKAGLLAGRAMTEKQGGSDVRANMTRAEPAPSAGDGAYVLTGHKWFNSAPMCDLFLVLAQVTAPAAAR